MFSKYVISDIPLFVMRSELLLSSVSSVSSMSKDDDRLSSKVG